ncbi:MAG: hypothetical protein AAF485_21470, partial [Chloroflexota bacterium]
MSTETLFAKLKWKFLLPIAAVGLVIVAQLYYLPDRVIFFKQLLDFAQIESEQSLSHLAYDSADYQALFWVTQVTPPDTTLLLLTATPNTYGDSSYVLYHRALYHLYPRTVWWAAPVPPTRYPNWWITTDLSEPDTLSIVDTHHIDAVWADGFTTPPLNGEFVSFDRDTHLVFPNGSPSNISTPNSYFHSVKSSSWWLTTKTMSWLDVVLLIVKTAGATVSIFLWGDILYCLLVNTWLSAASPSRPAIAWILGCGITSLVTFILLWAGLLLNVAIAGLSVVGVGLWLFLWKDWALALVAGRDFPALSTLNTWSLLFSVILLAQIARIIFATLVSPLTDWDAWVNWASKANILFIDQTISANLYNNPARLPTNMDYPLMLPLVEAWFYSWLGHIYEPVTNLISLFFYLALLLLFYGVVSQFTSPTSALGFTTLLATIPRIERLAHSGFADIPVAALVLLSALSFSYLYTALSPKFSLDPKSL